MPGSQTVGQLGAAAVQYFVGAETVEAVVIRDDAKVLAAWMKGTLTEDLAGQFVQYYQVTASMFPQCDWTVYIRMNMLTWLVSRQFGRLERDDAEAEREWLEDLAVKAASVNRNTQANPSWPQLFTKTSGAVFMLMDNLFRLTHEEGRVVALESFRTANQSGARDFSETAAATRGIARVDENEVPAYAGRRLEPAANLTRMGEALRAHRSPRLG